MSSGRSQIQQELQHVVEKASEKEGLTFTVLQEVVHQLRGRENNLLHLTFHALAGELQSSNGPDAVLDSVASRLGGLRPGSDGPQDYPGLEQQQALASLSEQRSKNHQRLQITSDIADSLEAAAQLQILVDEFDRLAGAGQFVEAADCAAQASRVAGQTDSDGTEAKLRKSLSDRRAKLAEHLAAEIRGSTIFSQPSSGSRRVAVAATYDFHRSWQALQALESTALVTAWLAETLLETLLLPLTATGGGITSAVSSEEAHVLSLELDGKPEESCRETAVAECLDFVHGRVVGDESAVWKQLGKLLWPKLAKAYIERILSPAVPHSEEEYRAFEELSEAAQALERGLVQNGFLEATASTVSTALPLHTFSQHALDRWLQSRRLDLVSEARALILAPDYETVTVGIPLPQPTTWRGAAAGADAAGGGGQAEELDWGPEGEEAPLLASGEYQISRTCQAVVRVMERGLHAACHLSSRNAAHSGISALRDIAALYTAIPSVTSGRAMQVPLLSALYHNDCHYLAEQLLLMPQCYPILQERLYLSVSLREDAMQLREAGSLRLKLLTEQQGEEIRQLLLAAEGFQKTHKAQRGIKARKVVRQCLHSLASVGGVLRPPVLAPAAFVGFGASLVGMLAGRITEDIMSIADISAEESQDLPRILEPVADEATAQFCGASNGETAAAGVDPLLLSRAVEEACLPLLKLKVVLEVLEAKLVSIGARWRSGSLQRCGLDSREVVHLVHALFEDTDLRRDVLKELAG